MLLSPSYKLTLSLEVVAAEENSGQRFISKPGKKLGSSMEEHYIINPLVFISSSLMEASKPSEVLR